MRTIVLVLLTLNMVSSLLISISRIGKPRRPFSPPEAVGGFLAAVLVFAGYVYLWGSC